MKNYKYHLLVPRNRAILYNNKRTVILQRIPQSKARLLILLAHSMLVTISIQSFHSYRTLYNAPIFFIETRIYEATD